MKIKWAFLVLLGLAGFCEQSNAIGYRGFHGRGFYAPRAIYGGPAFGYGYGVAAPRWAYRRGVPYGGYGYPAPYGYGYPAYYSSPGCMSGTPVYPGNPQPPPGPPPPPPPPDSVVPPPPPSSGVQPAPGPGPTPVPPPLKPNPAPPPN